MVGGGCGEGGEGGGVKPTLHVTNWSSRKLHGPGRVFTIMCMPRAWEWGSGQVECATPEREAFRSVVVGSMTLEDYRAHILAQMAAADLSPGMLEADGTPDGEEHVCDGDTLCCACSRAQAAAGRCHRVWVAQALAAAGWRVVLDGVEVTS